MNKRFSIIATLVILAFVVFTSGCASSRIMKLNYTKPPSETMNQGKIRVIVKDERSPELGGNNPTVVGHARSTFGAPKNVSTRETRLPVKVVKELISDCLRAAGYDVTDQLVEVPKIYAVLNELWCYGYLHYEMRMTILMDLKKGENSPSSWYYKLYAQGGVTLMWSNKELNKGYKRMLEDATKQLIAEFKSQEFNNSYKSLARR